MPCRRSRVPRALVAIATLVCGCSGAPEPAVGADQLAAAAHTQTAAPSACPTSTPLAAGDHETLLEYAGLRRSYLLHVPRDYDGSSAIPLVLDMHGLSVDGPQQQLFSAFDPIADEHGFAVVYPTSDSGSWNAGPCCNLGGPDDVAFMRLVVAEVRERLCIDPQRIYATGMSNGALMSQLLGCQAADLFAAIAPVSGPLLIPDEQCKPSRPMPVMSVHGLNDTLLGYEGDGYLWVISAWGTVVPSARESAAAWAKRNRCVSGPAVPTPKTDWPAQPPSGGVVPGAGGWIPDDWARNSIPITPGASCEWYSDCAGEVEVGLCTHDGGHDWPSGTSTAIWEFFERHSLP